MPSYLCRGASAESRVHHSYMYICNKNLCVSPVCWRKENVKRILIFFAWEGKQSWDQWESSKGSWEGPFKSNQCSVFFQGENSFLFAFFIFFFQRNAVSSFIAALLMLYSTSNYYSYCNKVSIALYGRATYLLPQKSPCLSLEGRRLLCWPGRGQGCQDLLQEEKQGRKSDCVVKIIPSTWWRRGALVLW